MILLRKYIPYKAVHNYKKSHPWLNDRCEKAIEKKNACEGQESFSDAQQECSHVMADEYHKYVAALKSKIASLDKGSKQ